MNIADQAGINERGEVIDKKQLTHNQSMTYSSGTSLNNKTIKDDLQDVMYGSCLCRVIHQIVEYRKRHPKVRILIQKVDFKSAYCHSHLDPATVIQTITQFVLLGLCPSKISISRLGILEVYIEVDLRRNLILW